MRLAELSRSIDSVVLGKRLRAARVAAGVTQAELAGDDVTSAYVSRIEAGQRRPEAKLLERFAQRVGVTLEVLLEPSNDEGQDRLLVLLDHAELSLLAGDHAGALTQLDAVQAELEGHARLLLRGRHLRAAALEGAGRISEAIALLEDLAQAPEADVRWIKAIIALSRCYRETGDFSRAISVGEGAAAAIDDLGLAGETEAIQLTITVAGAYLERGDLAHALLICRQCVAAAEKHNSPTAKASAYWNASIVEAERGNYGSALELARRAVPIFEAGEDSRNLGRLRTEIALMLLMQDPPEADEARNVLLRAEKELAWSAASQLDRARHQLLSAKAGLLLNDLTEATEHASIARQLAGESPILLSEAQAVTGQILAAQGDLPRAHIWYREAVRSLSSIGVDRWVARLWFELAGLLEEAGDGAAALDAYKRGATASGLADPQRMHATASEDKNHG